MASSRKPGSAEFLPAADALPARLRRFLRSRVPPAARLCLGYSGGRDSTVLLHALAHLREEVGFRLSALHVHHGLSPHADDWAAFCREACVSLSVPLDVRRVRVERSGQGTEAAARQARYAAYAAMPVDFLVLAHHQDDQVETFFLRLLRGSGVRGLAAMLDERTLGPAAPRLLRPLLDIPGAVVEGYARAHGLACVEDESNQDTGLARNWLRQVWLPVLAGHHPHYRGPVSRAVAHLAESEQLLEQLAEEDARRLERDGGLEVEGLLALDTARGRNLLRYWMRGLGGQSPTGNRLDELLRQLREAAPDAGLDWRSGALRLGRHRGVLLPRREVPVWSPRSWRGEVWLDLAGGGALAFQSVQGQGVAAAALAQGPVTVMPRQGGERFQPDFGRPRRPLKDWLRESGMPAWQRERLPILRVGEELAWVAGLGPDVRYRAGPDETGWLISWQQSD